MATTQQPVRLGDWLIESGQLSQSQLDLALREQKRGGKMLGQTLVDLGFVTQEVLAGFLANKTQTEQVDLSRLAIAPELLRLIPEQLARTHLALPVSRANGTLNVAIADPLNVLAFDALEQATRLRVNLVAATESDLRAAIDRHYASSQTVEDLVDELLRLGSDRLAITTEQDAPMIRLVDRVIAQAVAQSASDIHVQPEDKILRVRFRQDGILNAGTLLPKAVQPALIARFKILGNMDITESRRPQGGRGTVSVMGREVQLRFSSLPTAFGESIVVRILDRPAGFNLKAFGFSAGMEERFSALLEHPHGIILVTGPTGSGKTTTLYAALSRINGAEQSIFTLEDPVEFQLPLVRQTQINESIGLTFAEGLRTLLRQDPDVILVGETRDTETAQLAVRAALTGHLVFTTLHTNDALGAIPRLVDLGVEPYLLAPTLIGVIGQRLVRRLCAKCRQPVADAAAVLTRVGATLAGEFPVTLFQPGGCPDCRGTGYRGRVGIYELLSINPAMQSCIASEMNVAKLRELARANGFQSMFEDGIQKAVQGLTTIEEILRVTQG